MLLWLLLGSCFSRALRGSWLVVECDIMEQIVGLNGGVDDLTALGAMKKGGGNCFCRLHSVLLLCSCLEAFILWDSTRWGVGRCRPKIYGIKYLIWLPVFHMCFPHLSMLFNCSTVLLSLLQAQHRLCCLLCSIRDAVALILCPQGTADMDVCKLLTWCCLLCSLIKDGAALLFHNLPSNMLQVSQTPCLSVSHLLLTRDSPW